MSRDGLINPESRTDPSDQIRVGILGNIVSALALAYHFTGNEAYAEHAARCLRVWFLDSATRMTPQMEQGQAVPGINTGRAIGIFEAGEMVEAIDASSLLVSSKAWAAADAAGLKQWATEFLDWLLHSEMGLQEAAMQQNHRTMYDVRVVLLALQIGQHHLARRNCEEAKTKRIVVQIEFNGSQPLELRRTKSFNYSRLNLNGLTTLALLARWVDVDLWSFSTEDGRSLRCALDFMVPYVRTPPEAWPHPEIETMGREKLTPIFRAASLDYEHAPYEAIVGSLPRTASARFQLLRPTAAAAGP